jgi:NodT family efflux transporter outer membrane factor (OMF) lipoprotein
MRNTSATTVLLTFLLASGCTSIQDYFHNNCKVGPQYEKPAAPLAQTWIDANDKRVHTQDDDDLRRWWTVFKDPVLDSLVFSAYEQNLSLREAGFRILQARAQLGIAFGNIMPQLQTMTGSYTRIGQSQETANANQFTTGARWFAQWAYGFNMAWELDFWGRFRRAIESAEATLDASVEDYDAVLVTLLGDVASNYVNIRTIEQRIQYAKRNVEIQRETLNIVEGRFKAGTTNELDVVQARSTLEQTEAAIIEFEISLRLANNQLCILLGIPPEDLHARLGSGPIPSAPIDVVVGVPADLLRRRPDVRRAERQAAAQCALIGVAESEWYPHISIDGSFGWSAEHLNQLFREQAVTGAFGPSFTWEILNYGRILNNVRLQDARFQELAIAYQQAVLTAGQDVENGLVTFLRAQQRTKLQNASVVDAEKAVTIALAQYTAGVIDLTRVTLLEQTLVQQQDTLASAQGEIGLGLIQTYRALGGGWQIRIDGCDPTPPPAPGAEPAAKSPTTARERLAVPKPDPDTAQTPASPSRDLRKLRALIGLDPDGN